jgi:hypothetical protein
MSIALLARFPRLRSRSESSPPVVPTDVAEQYPVLADDIDQLNRVVAPDFTAYDRKAIREQNRYRRQQVLIVCGSALLTALGGVQALLPDHRWPGLLLIIAGVVLASSSRWAKERASLNAYLDARVRAERLRALHFRYLARVGPYAAPDRVTALRRAVLAVKAGREPD